MIFSLFLILCVTVHTFQIPVKMFDFFIFFSVCSKNTCFLSLILLILFENLLNKQYVHDVVLC